MAKKKTGQGKTTRAARAGQILAGLKKRFTNGSEKLTGKEGAIVITVDDAVAGLQALIDNRSAVVAARAAAKVTVDTENAKLPPLVALFNAIVAFIFANFGADAPALAEFGLEPHKARKPITAEEKAAAAKKRKATRQAKGEVAAKAATPTPEPNAQPAPAAPVTPPKA